MEFPPPDSQVAAATETMVHLMIGGESHGPFTVPQLRNMLRIGRIPQDTMCKPVARWVSLLPLMTMEQRIPVASKWYLRTDKAENGPFAFTQLQSMWNMGAVTADSLCCREEHWCPISDLLMNLQPATTTPHLNQRSVQHAKTESSDIPDPRCSAVANESSALQYFLPVGRIARGMWFLRNWFEFLIFLGIVSIAPEVPDGEISYLSLAALAVWAYLAIVAAAKRLHDIGWTAWLAPIVAIPLLNLVLLIFSGTSGPNRYGRPPGNRFFV